MTTKALEVATMITVMLSDCVSEDVAVDDGSVGSGSASLVSAQK